MKILIVYDSIHGNTEKIAKAMADAIPGEVKVLHVNEVNSFELKESNLIIVGSPTHGGRPMPSVQNFLNKAMLRESNGTNVAVFDTRLSTMLASIFGYAAGRIASSLKKKGGNLIAPPEGFFVKATKGPLKDGEVERAAIWAKEIIKGIK